MVFTPSQVVLGLATIDRASASRTISVGRDRRTASPRSHADAPRSAPALLSSPAAPGSLPLAASSGASSSSSSPTAPTERSISASSACTVARLRSNCSRLPSSRDRSACAARVNRGATRSVADAPPWPPAQRSSLSSPAPFTGPASRRPVVVFAQLAEHVGDIRAGALERLAAQLVAPRTAEQHRRQVVDRPAHPAPPRIMGEICGRSEEVPANRWVPVRAHPLSDPRFLRWIPGV